MADRRGFCGYRWPAGVVNQIALILALAVLLLAAEGLVSALFFGRRAHLPEAWWHDIVLRALALVFAVLLPLIRVLRERYPRLLVASVLSALTSLFRSVAVLLPSSWIMLITVSYYLLRCSAAAVIAVALLEGERLDEFLLGLPRAMYTALSPSELDDRADS